MNRQNIRIIVKATKAILTPTTPKSNMYGFGLVCADALAV